MPQKQPYVEILSSCVTCD